MTRRISKETVARCARMYRSNSEMARALHVSEATVYRLCRRYANKSPADQRKKGGRRDG